MIIRCPGCRQTISTLDRHTCKPGQIACPACGLPDAELEPCRYCKRRSVCRADGCIWCRGLVPGSKPNWKVIDGYVLVGAGLRISVDAANDAQAKKRAAEVFARDYPGVRVPVRWRFAMRPKYDRDRAS